MLFIRQGATHKIVIGPAVAVGDGFTPVTTLDVSTADEAEVILHDNGTVVDISGYTFAAITTADGYYHLTLQSGISGTVGHMTVVINDDSLILPLRQDFTVLEEAAYDAMYAASADPKADVNVGSIDANAITATSIAADAITAAKIAAGAIDAATFAADVDAEILSYLVDDATRIDASALNTAAVTSIPDILTDTGTTLQAELDAIQAAVITNAAGTDIAADIIALKSVADDILVDTGTTLDGRIPAALTAGGNMKSDMLAVDGSTAAAARMERAAETMTLGTCDTGSSTTAVIASSLAPASVVDDQWNGRIMVFDLNTTTTALRGQATEISDYVHSTLTFTVVALTTAPSSGDTFSIV